MHTAWVKGGERKLNADCLNDATEEKSKKNTVCTYNKIESLSFTLKKLSQQHWGWGGGGGQPHAMHLQYVRMWFLAKNPCTGIN